MGAYLVAQNIITKFLSILLKHGITAFHEKLDACFLRVHRSFIVNIQKITAYTKQDIEIGAVEIPIE